MRENWKLWLAGIIVVVALGIAIRRVRTSFTDKPPDWMHLTEVKSPRLSAEADNQILGFYREMEGEAKSSGLPIQSLHLVQIMEKGKDMQVWHLQKFINESPNPLDSFEADRWLTDDHLIGYYAMDGTPLTFMLRQSPTNPRVKFATIKLDKPIAGGATILLLYLERQPSNLKTNAAGEFSYQFGRLRNDNNSIQAMGVLLPQNYSLVRYGPTTGALTTSKGAPFVGWINTRLETVSLPPSATFKPL